MNGRKRPLSSHHTFKQPSIPPYVHSGAGFIVIINCRKRLNITMNPFPRDNLNFLS
jgi:hypothetical protein